MLRKYEPFNDGRFVGDTKTMTVHDLDNEKNSCEIDFIDPEHIKTFDRDRLKTAEELHFNHCTHCITPESYVKHSHFQIDYT